MQRRLKRLVGVAALAVAGLVVIAVFVLALPPVQLRLARTVAGAVEGVELELGHIWVLPWGAELEDVHVDVGAGRFELDLAEADVDIAFWSSLLGLRADVEVVALRGIGLDVQLSEEGIDFRKLAATGLAPAARLPAWLEVRRVDAAGDLVIRSASGRLEIGGPWELTAGSLAPAATATASVAATFDARRAGEPLAAAALFADARAAFDAAAGLVDFRLRGDVEPIAGGPGLRVAAAVALDERPERYTLELEGARGVRLAGLDARLVPDTTFDVGWEANLTRGVVAAFARGRSVADLSGRSTGGVRVDFSRQSVEIDSSTDLEGRGWDAFDPRLAELGALALDLELDAVLEPGVLRAEAVDVQLTSAARGELLSVTALQRLRYETGGWRLEPETWGEPSLRLSVSNFPLRWLGNLSPAVNLEGGQLSGAIELVRHEERRTELLVREPLRATGVRLGPVRGSAVPSFEIALVPHAALDDGALVAEIEQLTLTAATGLELMLEGGGRTSRDDWPLVDFRGSVSARVPALQRLMPEMDTVRGSTSVRFDFDALAMIVAELTVGADAVDGREMMAADLAGHEPLHVQLPQLAADWDGFRAQTASLTLDRVPIEWVSPYVPELEFRDGYASGRFEATGAVGEGLTLGTDGPLLIENVLPVYRGLPARDVWTATVMPRVRLTTAASTLELRDLAIVMRTGNEVNAEATITAPADSDRVAIALSLDADIAEFASHFGLRISGFHWRQTGELDPASRRFTLDELSIDFEDMSGTDIVVVESLRPFSMTTEPFGVSVDGGSPAIIRATVTPLRLEQLVPRLRALELEGTLPEGEFIGRAGADGSLILSAEAPYVFSDVSVRWDETVLLDRVTAGVLYEVAYSADAFRARSLELTATGPDGSRLLHATSSLVAPLNDVRLLNSASIDLQANLVPLARQPVLADLPRFTSGTLAASLAARNEADFAVTLDARLRDGVTETLGELPDVDLVLDASGVRGESLELAVPLRLESTQFGVSDLRLDGTLVRDADGVRDVAATLAGDNVAAADVQRFAALVMPREEEEAPATETRRLAPLSEDQLSAIAKLRAQRHEVPFWTDNLLADASVDLSRLVFPSFSLDGVHGRLTVAHESVALTDVRASLRGGELAAEAMVGFDALRPEPYTFGFHAEAGDIELEDLFREVSPDVPPTAEGDFELESTLTGSGLNPLDLGLSTLGEIRLSGRDGIFRGLAAHAGTGAVAARVIGVLTFSRELRAIARLLDGLGEIRFEEADFALERRTPDSIDVTALYVRSPQLEIDASGRLELAPLRPLLLSPLDVSAELAARGDIALVFDAMGLLEDEAGSDGYRDFKRVIEVRGTPAEPDTSAFWAILEEAAENTRGALGAGLRALNRRLEARRE